MPKIFTLDGISFYIYFDDHGKPHVHARYGGTEASIEIETGIILGPGDFDVKSLKKISKFVKENKEFFNEKWKEIQKESD
ncbi:MAG: DUF4160 domain-containing protein [Bdellovibrionales bacterium]|nr:DUF4160 domain-containing protein [Bdellovibrionales bacterium]MCB0414579.1 DUF4160 domain-containing protein [Bdellovibrionales bacterium]